MAQPARVLLLATALAVASAAAPAGPAASPPATGGTELEARVARLQRLLGAAEGRLDGVGRHLSDDHLFAIGASAALTPSIHADSSGTRPYTDTESFQGAITHLWLILCGALVLLMFAGLTLLKAGSCRVKAVEHVFLLSLWDVCMATLAWWIFGWAFAFTGPFVGDYKEAKFAGRQQFAGFNFMERRPDGQLEPSAAMGYWFFTWAISAVTIGIVSGGVAERNFAGYSIYCFLSTCFILPIVMGWTWGNGWLADMNLPGYLDFAGSGVVHMAGGFSALVGAAISGPRLGRWDGQETTGRIKEWPEHFIPHSQPLVVLGTLMAWFGWYGLNCGRTMTMNSIERGMLAATVAMNTTIAAAAGGIVAFFMQLGLKLKNDLQGMCFGILAGLVSISAGCSTVECGTALAIGAVAGLIYPGVSALLKVSKIDDPTDAFAVHGACGMWGLFCAAVMEWGKSFDAVHGKYGFLCIPHVMECEKDLAGNLVAANFAEMFSIIGWICLLSLIVILPLKFANLMQHDTTIQESGIDRKKHVPIKGYNFGIPTSADFGLHSI